ncbi:MAG: hypothetical protein ACREX8_15170 [Gammaproteobacteria bacterium]
MPTIAPTYRVVAQNFVTDVQTLATFGAGSFAAGWTHIAETPRGQLLFYNGQNGSAALGTHNGVEFETLKSFPADALSRGWTHIVAAGESMLFYNANDLSGAINFDPTVRVSPAGSFGRWTHLVTREDTGVLHP